MLGKPYTFDEMRATLVRNRDERHPALRSIPLWNDPDLVTSCIVACGFSMPQAGTMLERMIALIDAMTPEERTLSNVLHISADRQRELAAITGTDIREVRGLIAGRQSVDFVNRVYLDS
jgi:hypothetical protein